MHFSFISSFILSTYLWLIAEGGKEGKNLEIFLQPPFPFLKSEHQMWIIWSKTFSSLSSIKGKVSWGISLGKWSRYKVFWTMSNMSNITSHQPPVNHSSEIIERHSGRDERWKTLRQCSAWGRPPSCTLALGKSFWALKHLGFQCKWIGRSVF